MAQLATVVVRPTSAPALSGVVFVALGTAGRLSVALLRLISPMWGIEF